MLRSYCLVVALALVACSKNPDPKPTSSAPPPPAVAPLESKAAPATEPPVTAVTTAAPEQVAGVTVETGGRCSVDSVNGEPNDKEWTVAQGKKAMIGGWVLDPNGKTTSDWAVVRLDGAEPGSRYYLFTTWRGERPDLIQVFGASPGMRNVTFTVVADTTALPPGTYKMTLLHKPAATAQSCDSGKVLSITR